MATEFNLYVAEIEWRAEPEMDCWASRTARYAPFAVQRVSQLPGRNRSFEFIGATPAKHTALQADAKIVRLLPTVSATLAQMQKHRNSNLVDIYTPTQLTALRTRLEALGFNLEWITDESTLRHLLQRIMRHLFHAQRAHGQGGAIATLFSLGLDTTVKEIPADTRNELRGWFGLQSLDLSWVDRDTKVRAILRFLSSSTIYPKMSLFGVEEV